MEYFDKTYHPPGTSPGTLIDSGKVAVGDFSIHLIDYTDSDFIEKELATTDECRPYLAKDSITWVHLQGSIHARTIEKLGHIFELHPLSLEDILNRGQRPKIEEYDDLLFVIMSMPVEFNDVTVVEQVSVFLGENYIISFYAGSVDPFDPLRQRLRKKNGSIRNKKADYLLYCIVDLVIDQGYPILEVLGEKIEIIEEQLLSSSAKKGTLTEIHQIRRELLLLRRNLWPQREVVNKLLRDENPLIKEGTSLYIRDCYDHTIQILDLLENYREMATSLIDIYLSSASQRLNEIMRVLTMIATIFIPLTFVVGLYGMNFSHPDSPWAMPELHWYFGYPMVWAVMLTIVAAMVLYFKRKDWF
ncbi:MAG: magnesium/cobalt transporter CorA [Gammaproteobacteria bacterium]|nr:magnesium/cobalt transporter CorA [Gammaproteobacteria bacterium]